MVGFFIGEVDGFVILDIVVVQVWCMVCYVVNFGLFYGNWQIFVIIGYEFCVLGFDILLDLDLDSVFVDVMLCVNNVIIFQSYIVILVIVWVDNWLNFQIGMGDFIYFVEYEFIFEIVLCVLGEYGVGMCLEVVGVVINIVIGVIMEFNNVYFVELLDGFDELQIFDIIQF